MSVCFLQVVNPCQLVRPVSVVRTGWYNPLAWPSPISCVPLLSSSLRKISAVYSCWQCARKVLPLLLIKGGDKLLNLAGGSCCVAVSDEDDVLAGQRVDEDDARDD